MAPNTYNNYYDPVGSQQNQPNSYTYQQAPGTSNAGYASSSATTYPSHNSHSYTGGYNTQYGGAQATRTSANHTAAAALSSLSSQECTQLQNSRQGRGNSSTSWTPANSQQSANYRSQTEGSSMYGNQPSSGTFGRLSMLNGSSVPPSTAPSYTNTDQDQYNSWYAQQQQAQSQQSQPQRYASPLHAVQAQQQQRDHQSRPSTVQRSPHLTNQQSHQPQQSGSVEPAQQTTVDPSQVYDIRAEQQRKAQIELEKKRKRDEAAAARKAEEDRVAEEKRKAAEAERKAEEEKLAAEAAKRLAESNAMEKQKKAAARKKAREEKKQSTSAAATLATMASTTTEPSSTDAPVDEEAEMRAMFLKMRQFNAKNPQMLAKLWEEERLAHASPTPPKGNARPELPASRSPANVAPPPSKAAKAATAPKVTPTPATLNAHNPMTQQQKTAPVASSAASSLWPPQKKGLLSEIAAKWLMSLPSNAGKVVRRDEVLKILDGNPNYVQLCEAFEARGLVFERAQLARELLKSVPDNSDKPQANTQARSGPKGGTVAYRINVPKKTAGTVSYEAPSFKPLPTPAAYGGLNAPTQVPGPYMPHGGPVMPPGQPVMPFGPPTVQASQMPEIKSDQRAESAKPEAPPRPPANKEEAARKRTFTDLVDLTAGDSDDEAPPKMMKFSRPPHVAPVPNHGQQLGMGASVVPKPYGYAPPIPGPSNYMRGPDMSNASHPPAVVNKGPSFEYFQQQNRIKGKMLVEPIMRDRVARKSQYDPKTIARDVLLATGRHPDMRGLNMHLAPLEKLLGSHGGSYDTADGSKGNRSDLSTIRWDLIDPDPPASMRPTAPAAISSLAPSKGSSRTPVPDLHDIYADDEHEDEAPIIFRQPVDNGDGTMSMAAVYGSRGPVKGVKRKGRPPGPGKYAKMLSSDHLSNIRSAAGNGRNPAGTGTPQLRERPAAPAETATPIGYAAFRNLDENGVKKKGRPVGWRKAIHSREAQGLTPAKPGSSGSSSRLRPNKDGGQELEKPKYQIYKCMWLDCSAELHNMDTLKKHIVKVHGKASSDGEFKCLWHGCEGANSKGKGRAGSSDNVLGFDALGDWIGHMDSAHLQPVAWQKGDGPRGGQSDFHETTDSEAYLSDTHGRSVTPVIRPDMPPPSSRVVPDRPMSRDVRRAAEELQKLEDHKRTVGFTMEKSGTTLATSKRRRGFMDDEDFEDVIHEDEPDPWA